MAALTFIDAVRAGLREEMARDRNVYVLGEDVAVGGPFGATRDLAQEFGEHRVRNTPISEGTIVGLATGAAALGLRPVVEVMFVDFITLAMDQLVNHAAKLHYMSGGQLRVPLVIRAQGGVAGGYGAHHSQSLEAWFMHTPGLKVVAPSNAADAKGLLKSAIRDDNPVMFLEHRGLYWARAEVADGDHVVPLGRAATRREGTDVTIVAYSKAVATALAAAERLAADGTSADVIDIRSLCPLDLETIVTSARKTRRVVIVHEAVAAAGVGAEIAARLQEAAFDALDAPVARVTAEAAPAPFSPPLEKAFAPGPDDVVRAVRRLAAAPTRRS